MPPPPKNCRNRSSGLISSSKKLPLPPKGPPKPGGAPRADVRPENGEAEGADWKRESGS